MNESEFAQQLREAGYGEAERIEYEPHKTSELHTHEFSCRVLVVGGELTLKKEHGDEVYRPGETFTLEAGTLHAEHTGAGGAAFLIGRKQPARRAP